MGFIDNSQRKIYCGISKGKIAYKDRDGAIITHGGITGYITDIIHKPDGKFGPELHIILFDGTETFQLQMRFESGYSRAFLKIIKNAVFTDQVTIVPTYKEKEGSPFAETGMIMSQNGSALKWFYTKDNPNGLPPMEKVKAKVNGKLEDVWDNTEQMNFLLRMVNEEIKPMLKPMKVIERNENVAAGREKAPESDSVPDLITGGEPFDDLPF